MFLFYQLDSNFRNATVATVLETVRQIAKIVWHDVKNYAIRSERAVYK